MINLLPQEEKKKVRRFYRSRLLGASLVTLIVVTILLICMLVPSYIIFYSKTQVANENLEDLSTKERQLAQSSLSELQTFRTNIAQIGSVLNKETPISERIELIFESKPNGLKVDYINVDEDLNFEIRGIARSRDDITNYTDYLNSILEISNVDSPLSNLIEDTDGPFVIKFTFSK